MTARRRIGLLSSSSTRRVEVARGGSGFDHYTRMRPSAWRRLKLELMWEPAQNQELGRTRSGPAMNRRRGLQTVVTSDNMRKGRR